jgi:hypothetical protein
MIRLLPNYRHRAVHSKDTSDYNWERDGIGGTHLTRKGNDD